MHTALLVQSQGSLAGAARVLEQDPSSVSRVIATLEAELGFRLFQRTTRKLTVTDEGRLFLTRLAPLLEDLNAAKEAAYSQNSQPRGMLRMTASVAFSYQMIVPLMPQFQQLYPKITVDLQSSDVNLDLVENGIDLALRLAPAPKGDLISTRLMRTQYHVVASPEFIAKHQKPDHPGDLTQFNCLRIALPGLQNVWRFRGNDGENFEVTVDGTLLVSNPLVLRKAAQTGVGVTMLADWLIKDDLETGRLIDLFPEYSCSASDFDTAAWALYPSRTYLPQKVRVMINFLKSQLSQTM